MLRFGLIGTGEIVTKFIAGVKLCNDIKICAIYSRKIETANAFGDKFGIEHRFDNIDAFAASDKFDAVYIASPTALHAPQSLLMIKNKKHVLCEKPAASNVFEFETALTAAKENGVVVLEAMRPLFAPGLEWIKNNLHKIGTVHQANLKFCKYSSRYDNFKNGIIENAFNPELSNGALMDIGVYPAAVMRCLFGNPKSITGVADIIKGSIDASGTAIADYGNFNCTLTYSKVNDCVCESEIMGENGSILYSPGGNPKDIYIVYRDGREEKSGVSTLPFDMCYETQKFYDLIKNGGNEEYNEMTLDVLKMLDKIRAQCKIAFPADKALEENL